MSNSLDSTPAEASGWVTVTLATGMHIIEWLGQYDISDYAQVPMYIGGAIFLFYRAANARLDYREKKRNDRKQK